MPEVSWIDREITIAEGENGEICFTSSTGSAQVYTVTIGARGKGISQASGNNPFV